MQEIRWRAVHTEGHDQFHSGDVLQRGRERRREGCMDQGIIQRVGVDANAEELGS